MKKICSVLFCSVLFCSVLAKEGKAMGEREKKPESDPTCFVSDKLRVKIGDVLLAIPREELKSLSVEAGSKYDNALSSYPEKLCQKLMDAPIQTYGVFIVSTLLPCDDISFDECVARQVPIRIAQAKHPSTELPSKKEIVAQFMKECAARKYHKNYCRHYFHYGDFHIKVQYHLGAYPEENIENTVTLLLQKLNNINTSDNK